MNRKVRKLLLHLGRSVKRSRWQGVPATLFSAFPFSSQLQPLTSKAASRPASFQASSLEAILQTQAITTHFQPIVDLRTGNIIGHEALSRGPLDSPLHSPVSLFQAADTEALLTQLEDVCLDQALKNAAAHQLEGLLFLNVNPVTLGKHARNFSAFLHRLRQQHLGPAHIVFELTERTAIQDFDLFRNSISRCRHHQFTIAIDDAGAGYSSLQAIAELQPEYIKIDRSLIQNIQESNLKKALLSALVDCGHAIHAKLIAEGIETSAELTEIIRLGVDYGQGFLLARPAAPPPLLAPEYRQAIQTLQTQCHQEQSLSKTFGLTIGDIAQYCPSVSAATLVCDLEDYLHDETTPGIVITENDAPHGLLMKNRLYSQLGTQFGISLYYQRPVERIMDRQPLVVSADLPLEAVSQIAMSRHADHLYDLIIVVKDGAFHGVVSIIHLLKNVTNLQIRRAFNANPLTGLPGNLIIEERLKNLIAEKNAFAVLYIDLDNFKAFNDKYGFERGDQALLHTARLLSSCLAEHCASSTRDFLGHIGGDDFVIITTQENGFPLCQTICLQFDQDIHSLYPPEDLQQQHIRVLNRKGEEEVFPLMSLSIAVVHNQQETFGNYLEISELAASLKKKAKKIPGSAWCADRRSAAPPQAATS